MPKYVNFDGTSNEVKMEIKQVCEVLEKLNNSNLDKEKEQILRENDCEELRYLLKLAYDPYIHFGIKDFKLKNTPTRIPNITEIKKLEQNLTTRQLTGNAAKIKVENNFSCNNDLVIKYLTSIFQKNLRIGCGIKTINKVFPKLIPEFEVGLCEVFKPEEHNGELPQNCSWVLEPKFDGLRCITIIDKEGNIEFLSRSGKELYNLGHIEEELKSLGLKSMVLDGEIYAGNWYDTIAIVHSEKNILGKDPLKTRYYVFDWLSSINWESKCSAPYFMRKIGLRDFFSKTKNIICVEGKEVSNIVEAKEEYSKFLELGFEGAVLKEVNSQYPFKRSVFWLKWKPFYSEDLKIVGYEEGEGRNKGRLGKFLVDYKGVTIGVGGGYSDKLREKFWKEKDSMVGKIIEVKYWEVTKDNSLRFPVFLRVREDK